MYIYIYINKYLYNINIVFMSNLNRLNYFFYILYKFNLMFYIFLYLKKNDF